MKKKSWMSKKKNVIVNIFSIFTIFHVLCEKVRNKWNIIWKKKSTVPLKHLVFSKLHARKIQMPSQIFWVPRQRPNCFYFIFICGLVNTIGSGIKHRQSKEIKHEYFLKNTSEKMYAHIWFQSLCKVFFQLSTDVFKKLAAASKIKQWLQNSYENK